MKIQWKKLILCIAIPLAVGGLSAFLTRNNMNLFDSLQKPPFTPPSWAFPVVWTILYILMGFASYRICTQGVGHPNRTPALVVYGIQLVFNFFWSLIFFNLQTFLPAFFWLMALWVMIIWLLLLTRPIDRVAFWCLLPYLIWVTIAAYLNLFVYLLNR